MASCNSDYASKGLANGVGIPALVLGSLGFLQSGGLGGLGGILGGGRGIAAGAEVQYVSQLQAENAGLKAEQRGDEKNTALYSQTLRDNRNLRDEMFSFIKPLSDEAANNRVEIATLKAEMKCSAEKADLREQIVLGKVNEVALTAKGRFDAIDQTIAALAGTVGGITKTVVPNAVICPGWGPVCTQPVPCPTGTQGTMA